MSNPILIELREDTSDNTLQAAQNAGEFQVTLNNPLILKENDELSLSSAFVDSVATNSGKIIIDPDETDFTIKNFVYINNYEYVTGNATPFQRDPNPSIVKGLNDGFDYVACANTNTTTSSNTSEITGWSIPINMNHFQFGHNKEKQDPITFHVKYKAVNGTNMKFTIPIGKQISLKKEIARAGTDSNGNPNQGFYTSDDFKADFGKDVDGYPFDFQDGTLEKDSPFITEPPHSGTLHGGFNEEFFAGSKAASFEGIKLTPHIFTYNFTIPAGAYDPSEFARILTDKVAAQNISNPSGDVVNFTDIPDDNGNKYLQVPRSFLSPYLHISSTLAAISRPNVVSYGCRSDGEGIIIANNNDLLFGSTQVGVEFDVDQNKFLFSQLHTPFYLQTGNVSAMGTQFTNVKAHDGSATDQNFVANKNGGVGFTELQPANVWFKKMGMDTSILTNFGVRDFDGNGKQFANYKNITDGATSLLNLSPITFVMNDGVNTTGNFTSLDSAVLKSTPRVLPSDLALLKDTSQIIKQIYARNSLNEGGSLPYFLIEIDGKGINSDIRGGVASSIINTKISAIVSRYYQTLSYTSSMDGSGAIPYIHKGQPLMIDSFKVRILDPNGELSDNIQDSNVIFLQHTPANQ